MKRMVILALASVLGLGVVTVAASDQVSQTCKLPCDWTFTELSEYSFAGTGYQAPGAAGCFVANGVWHLSVVTNCRLNVKVDLTKAQFTGTYEGTPVSLPTEFKAWGYSDKYNIDGDGLGWLGPASLSTGGWVNISTVTPLVYTGQIDPANHWVKVQCRLYRSGYSDPATTYTSTIKVYVWR